MTRRRCWLAVVGMALVVLAATPRAPAQEKDKPAPGLVRLASGVSGHIHPAACVAKNGAIVVIFSQSDFKDLRIARSTDGGKTWSRPAPVTPTEKLSIYPGSLTTLKDGRLLHVWNTWYSDPKVKGGKSRHAQFSLSDDEGQTWSTARSLPKNPTAHSVNRHAVVELGPRQWLFSLSDKSLVYDPQTEKAAPFGEGRDHGLVPIVRTVKGTLVSGAGLRSTDGGKTWEKVAPFPAIGSNGWRFDLTALSNGWLVASEVLGPGVGGHTWRFIVSRDDGRSWDFDGAHVFYSPGRPIGGRACPKTVQLDCDTLGTVFYDVDAKQPGGPGVFFLRTPLAKLAPAGKKAAKQAAAVDLASLPADTWVPLEPTTVQPANPDEHGYRINAGWNKLVYDPDGKRVLFYDRWHDRKHGGTTIYGNCLFSFDPATARLVPLKIDNWTRRGVPGGGYRTMPLPANDTEPTPCSRHVYHGFDYVPDLNAVFICNGANQSALRDEKRRSHNLCADTWRFDLTKKTWSRIASTAHPPNRLEDGMAYCPNTKSIVYAGHGKIWILPIATGQWRQGKMDLPRYHMGMTVFYDAPRKRLLLAGGGTYGKWQTKAGGFNTLYAFDPVTEKVTRLADCPTAMCRAGLTHDTRRDLFFLAAKLEGKGAEQPSGVFAYDPAKDSWYEVKTTNPVPGRGGWLPLCYDAAHDCLIGMAGSTFYAFRYLPEKGRK